MFIAIFDKLEDHVINSNHAADISNNAMRAYKRELQGLKDSGVSGKLFEDKKSELDSKTYRNLSTAAKTTEEIRQYANSVKSRVESKEWLLSQSSFSGGSSERLVIAIELKAMPPSLVALHLQDAVESKNLAMLYQILLVHGERRNESAFKETVDIQTALDAVEIPGQAQARANIATINADRREVEICVAETSGRESSTDRIALARMRQEAANLAKVA